MTVFNVITTYSKYTDRVSFSVLRQEQDPKEEVQVRLKSRNVYIMSIKKDFFRIEILFNIKPVVIRYD